MLTESEANRSDLRLCLWRRPLGKKEIESAASDANNAHGLRFACENTFCANGTFSTIINAILGGSTSPCGAPRNRLSGASSDAGNRSTRCTSWLISNQANRSSWRGDQWRERQLYRESRAVRWTFNRATRESEAGHTRPTRASNVGVYRVCRGSRFLPSTSLVKIYFDNEFRLTVWKRFEKS